MEKAAHTTETRSPWTVKKVVRHGRGDACVDEAFGPRKFELVKSWGRAVSDGINNGPSQRQQRNDRDMKYKDVHCPSLYSISITATLTTNAKRVLAIASMNAILKQNQRVRVPD